MYVCSSIVLSLCQAGVSTCVPLTGVKVLINVFRLALLVGRMRGYWTQEFVRYRFCSVARALDSTRAPRKLWRRFRSERNALSTPSFRDVSSDVLVCQQRRRINSSFRKVIAPPVSPSFRPSLPLCAFTIARCWC